MWSGRNCDSIFGQGDTVNDLSWISTSSHAIDQLDDTPKSGFRSSYSEGRVLKSTLESETDKKLMPAGDHLAITDFDNGKGSDTLKKGSWNSDASDLCAYSNWFDADTENKEDSASIDQVKRFVFHITGFIVLVVLYLFFLEQNGFTFSIYWVLVFCKHVIFLNFCR